MTAEFFLDSNILLESLSARQRWQISYWDAQIITAARFLGCATVFSEDLNDGQSYDGVRVTNPFSVPAQEKR
jgi:predicted nucleic acid-binding protein